MHIYRQPAFVYIYIYMYTYLYIYIYMYICSGSAAPQRRRKQREVLSGARWSTNDLTEGCPAKDFARVARATGGPWREQPWFPRRRIRGSPRGEIPCHSRSGGRYPQELGSSPLPQVGVRTSHELERVRSPPQSGGATPKAALGKGGSGRPENLRLDRRSRRATQISGMRGPLIERVGDTRCCGPPH